MDFAHREQTPFATSLVYRTHRDHLEAVVEHLDAVRRVELRSRAVHADGRLEQLYRWHGTKAALPVLVRPFVPEHLLVWEQRTTWNDEATTAEWSIEVPGLGPAIDCRGTNTYHEAAGGSRIDISGAFAFRPERVDQLSTIPASAVPMVERMVVSLVVPLVQQSGNAVADYLRATSAPTFRGPGG